MRSRQQFQRERPCTASVGVLHHQRPGLPILRNGALECIVRRNIISKADKFTFGSEVIDADGILEVDDSFLSSSGRNGPLPTGLPTLEAARMMTKKTFHFWRSLTNSSLPRKMPATGVVLRIQNCCRLGEGHWVWTR